MSLRTRLLLVFGGIVVITVALISYAVSVGARRSFEKVDNQRATAIAGQFQREFELQGDALSLRAAAIARSQPLRNMALALSSPGGDRAPYLNLAGSLAAEQQLDFLEILSQDGTIISSAQWPARFGVHLPWAEDVPNWNRERAFLQYEETPDAAELALVSVRELAVVDRRFIIVTGQRIDSGFLRNLVVPDGTRVLLWQPSSSAGELKDDRGTVSVPAELRPVLEQSMRQRQEVKQRIRLDDSPDGAYMTHAIPQTGRDSKRPLAILVVASSSRDLRDLQKQIRNIGLVVAIGGIVLSILASGWSAGRISRPIEELSAAAQDVAAGNWERKVDAASRNNKDEVAQLVASFNQMTDELLRQRDRALQAERVAAWRELARRLAHELKNPMFPLQITIENLMKARQHNSPEFEEIFAESASTLLAELGNLKKIVGRFSDFSKMPVPQLQRVNLNQILEEIAKLFTPQLASATKPIKLETKLCSSDATISADPELLRRAFENLMLNAIDAMPDGGVLRMATSADDGSVAVEISDTGAGMDAEEASRVFTPYYTTKQHGTGLGLAIVQSVISDHGARISVHSRPGEGTTFRMEFPRQPAKRSNDAVVGRA
ncbi:MAG TPA: ATP-binding protein [Terriglobales bacterium]|jgi:two-component system nitrogen regulation sensor histidine kinase NtrY|nr:ATP-binding protein [Terriglobales bacterium]